jgi:hypothetical protein
LEPTGGKLPRGIELLFRGEVVRGESVVVKTAVFGGENFHAVFSENGKESVVAKIKID